MVESALILALVAAIITKFVDFSRYVKNGDKNGALTQIYVWVVSVLTTLAFAKSGLMSDVVLPFSDMPFEQYGLIAQILIGLAPGSLGSVVVDLRKAVDNTDSAKQDLMF